MILLGRLLFKNKKLFKFIQKNKCFFIVCLLAFVFFLGTSSFYFLAQSDGFIKWTSPDETANYIFTKLYAQSSKLTITEKYNLYTESIMHPRSFRADGEILKPVSFLGIILSFNQENIWRSKCSDFRIFNGHFSAFCLLCGAKHVS